MNHQELLQTFALANEFKEGDLYTGGTQDERIRAEARRTLAAIRLGELAKTSLVKDSLGELLSQSIHKILAREISTLTVAAVKRFLLSSNAEMWWQSYRDGLSSEAIAAVVKLMSNDELAAVARKFFPLPAGDTVIAGSPQHFGSRIQANSPRDDEEEILFSILEGLSYGCGDVMLSVIPAFADLETIIRLDHLLACIVERLKLPTRFCVLADIAAHRSIKPDIGFLHLAGTAKAFQATSGLELNELLDRAAGFDELCFETSQGIELVENAAEQMDMVTLESRAFGLARQLCQSRRIRATVFSTVGLNGQGIFQTGDQLLRACLESTVLAKLHGLPIGLNICSTFQMGIDHTTLQQLTAQIVELAAPDFVTATAGNVDPTLGCLTTSFREHPRLRRKNGKRIMSAMHQRLDELGAINGGGHPAAHALTTAKLYAQYAQAGGDGRSDETLQAEGLKKLEQLKQRGFDLGYGHIGDFTAPKEVERHLEAIYAEARRGMQAVAN
ncbi:MAG TPA: ethanolamine ammonia-lyase subunit EutB [Blastocatellia bacterium]|nr:ethanolamine ammonia-lyase subunit EutB [Blastocatellia bacterium]HMX27778.1 ethanolamine ammonia-lyase subunit EutB [Blastocatellia bacterium]HNG31613.1 ethanolamine ammonia-lyase subunit EutB [Blastocatellia bacterium]